MNVGLVSIITPVYNSEKFLNKCIDSILNQTYNNFELILVDDGSADKSLQICDEYARKDSRIVVIHQKNQGQAVARNKALDICKGDYISFIDSDDYLKRNFLETYMHAAQKKDADIIVGGYIRDVNGKLSETPIDVNDDTFVWMNVSACTKVYKRKFLEDNHLSFYGVRRYEDEGFMYRCLACHPVVELMAYSGYYYYMNSESITRSSKSDRTGIVKEYFQTVNKLADTVKCDRETQPLLNYCLFSGLTANMLYNGQGCG